MDEGREVRSPGSPNREVTEPNRMADRTWFYHAASRNLQVRVHVNAGEDNIINVK